MKIFSLMEILICIQFINLNINFMNLRPVCLNTFVKSNVLGAGFHLAIENTVIQIHSSNFFSVLIFSSDEIL